MKKLLMLSLTLGAVAGNMQAQWTLDQTKLPTPGSVQYMNIDTIAKKTPSKVPSNVGSYAQWDFKFLISARKDTTYYTAPTGTGNESAFPQATVVGTNAGTSTMYKISSSEYASLGTYTAGAKNQNRTYNGSGNYAYRNLKLPLTLNTAYSDTQRYITSLNNPFFITILKAFAGINADSLRTKHYEVKNVKCDGYGTILLPNNISFWGTLRVRDTSVSYDTTEYYADGSWQSNNQILAPRKVVAKTVTWYTDSAGFPFPAVRVLYTNGTSLNTISYLNPVVAPLSVSLDAINARCNGESNASIGAKVSGASPAYTYKWSTGASTSSIVNIAAGSYSITVTDSKGASLVKSTTVSQPDPIALTASGKKASAGKKDGEVYIDATGGNGIQFFGFEYLFNWSTGQKDDLAGDPVSDTLTAVGAGTYVVTVTDTKGCSATTSYVITENPISGISSLARNELSSLYPNPCSSNLHIAFDLKTSTPVTIKITDMMGREVMMLKNNELLNAGSYDLSFDVHSLPNGVFFYQIEKNGIIETGKISHVSAF